VNRYKNGYDAIGWHQDNEPTLDPTAPIACVSLGAVRPFTLRHRDDGGQLVRALTVKLESGSLFIMHPPTNEFYKHTLPRAPLVKDCRISLTFRKMLTDEEPLV